MMMWTNILLLLLPTLEAAVASQCWQGATFSEAVVSPAVASGGILRVPGVSSMPQCVAACCDLPGYDLAWLFEGHCYILRCQQVETCRPHERPGADSVLVFLRRASPKTLMLESLVHGEPYGWRTHSRSSSENLEALKHLALFDGRDFSEPVDYLDESPEQRGGAKGDALEQAFFSQLAVTNRTEEFNQSEVSVGPTESTLDLNHDTTVQDVDRTTTPSDPAANRTTTLLSLQLMTDVNNRTSSATNTRLWTSDTPTEPPDTPPPDPPRTVSMGHLSGPAEPTTGPTTATVMMPHSSSPSPAPATRPGEPNQGPVAVVGPDRTLVPPVDSLLLDGSGSTDDHGIVRYRWDFVSGPPGLKMDGSDQAVATATGLRVGRYTFRLTVSDQEGATDSGVLTVRIQQAKMLPPVAHASGSHTLTLPNNSLVLRGSVTDGDQTQLTFLWVRDGQSPAAGVSETHTETHLSHESWETVREVSLPTPPPHVQDVLYESDSSSALYLANLVEGTYLFQLRVTDAQGRSSSSTATVEVQPEPGAGEQVELEMLVPVSQISVVQRNTVVRQLAALIHILDSDVQVRSLQGHSHLSSVLRFWVRGPSGPMSSSSLVRLLRNQLLKEKSHFLLFRVLRVDTVVCFLGCSGRGQCDPVTKECSCDPFWTQNPIRRYLGDGESNCEWRVLYVIVTSFVVVVVILCVGWTLFCCCRRSRQSKARRKTRYTVLDNMDEQERVELRPKFSIKHRSTEHNSSLMMSESELDSDQDAIFSRDRPARTRNRISAARNGNAFG
ncbi:dyslexia-associated protein KIAA0319 homolog isoform X2 [Synchiropus splendidus]|uniref:dyslexia-associated protein KIAA0319 homolog isoform X2 n=1 Tax=Synchiropus splendidus TaxID=270530 RepID=UPI00237EE3A9|nr:dyslexia-associated protein KIAA0319 homolog isoform X2 [Synchiropus splendidus]